MRRVLLAGAVVAALWGGAAFAGEQTTKEEGSDVVIHSDSTTVVGEEDEVRAGQDLAAEEEALQSKDLTQEGEASTLEPQPPAASSSVAVEEEPFDTYDPYFVEEDEDAWGGSGDEGRHDMRGLTVLIGGGVEGYTGALAPQVEAGPSWGVTAAIKPTRVFGVELGYSGAANEIGDDLNSRGAGGADIVRNGGHALATLGLTATPLQPYVLAGVGIHRTTVRGGEELGFKSDTAGSIPLGAGLRAHVGDFTADLRGSWGFLVDEEFAPNRTTEEVGSFDFANAGRWSAMLNVGGTF